MDPTEQLEIETRIGEVLKSVYDPEIPVNIYAATLRSDIVAPTWEPEREMRAA